MITHIGDLHIMDHAIYVFIFLTHITHAYTSYAVLFMIVAGPIGIPFSGGLSNSFSYCRSKTESNTGNKLATYNDVSR